jgi:hypothetical protein
MHPAIHYDLMQARQHDALQSAAQRHLAAQAKTTRRARRNDTAAASPRRGLRRVWRLLPA